MFQFANSVLIEFSYFSPIEIYANNKKITANIRVNVLIFIYEFEIFRRTKNAMLVEHEFTVIYVWNSSETFRYRKQEI